MSTAAYDAIIIGAGHNGLVTACYLARAGQRVLVLERRDLVGGACVTEEVFPGFKVSTAAYVNSLFRKEIIRDLRLDDHGFELLERNPSSFTPFPDGRSLLLGPDPALNRREIAKFSPRDAERYPKYEAMLERVADFIEPTLTMTPPDLLRPGLRDLWQLFKLGRSFQRLGPAASEAIEILTGAARPILDRWFESEQLKGTLATDAIIGAMAPRRCRARPTCCSTTSWARPTASAACGATCAAAWAASPRRWPAPPRTSAWRSAATPRWRRSSCATATSRAWPWPTATSSAPDRRQQRRRPRDLHQPARPRTLPPNFSPR